LLVARPEVVVTHRVTLGVLLAATLITAGATRGDATEVVQIRLQGRYYVAPATVRVVVTVEPDADNRLLRIAADSPEMFRASDVTLSGASEKRTHSVEFKNLPEGDYTLTAEVLSRSEQLRGMATQELVVTGIGGR
jgi:hypothetical protein